MTCQAHGCVSFLCEAAKWGLSTLGLACNWLEIYALDIIDLFLIFLAQIRLHTYSTQYLWNLSIIHPMLIFISFDALLLCDS